MGYIHDNVSFVIPVTQFAHTAGTWNITGSANVWYSQRAAADAGVTTYVPLGSVPQRDGALKGTKINSVDFHFRVLTAALDAMEAHVYKATMGADGSLLTVAEVTTTYDTGHDSASERIDVDEHKMTLSITTPFYLEENEMLFLEVVYDAAATSVIQEYYAVANGTVRL
jgi:hypothetical protein